MTASLAKLIDHTALKPDVTKDVIEKLCIEAKEYGFASVCVNPYWIPFAKSLLEGSETIVCTVIGFPLGATFTDVKAYETSLSVKQGADEVDMVINIGALKDKDDATVTNDIAAVVAAANGHAEVKVILETCLLTEEEITRACRMARIAGADFVKTSTGFSSGGATEQDVRLMRDVVGPNFGVKASGGIRDRKTADAMIQAGATRIGASASVQIIKGD